MAAVPSIGRADRAVPREADLTRALYERYAAQIFRYCLHQLGSREEAEDAVQSTFLNAFRGIKRGIVPEHESAWLFKIAENVCLSRRRSSWRRGRVESPTDFEVVEELAPAPSRLADELVGLQEVLEQMPESQRRAILLREWQGLSYREIGEELQLSQTAVETLIFRARRSLAKGLEAPPELARKRRFARSADLGNLVAGLKSLLLGGGAAAAKVAAVVAIVSTGTVVAASPSKHHPPAKAHHAAPALPKTVAPAPQVASIGFRRASAPAPHAAKPAAHVHVHAPAATVATNAPTIAPDPVVAADVSSPPPPVPDERAPVASEPPAKQTAPRVDHTATPPTHPVTPQPTTDGQPDNPGPPSDPGNGNGQDHGQGQGTGQDQGQGQGLGDPGQNQGQSNAGGNGQGHGGGAGHGH